MKIRRESMFIGSYLLVLFLLAVMGYVLGDYAIKSQEKQLSSSNKNFTTDVTYLPLPRMSMSVSSSKGSPGRLRIDMTLEVEQKNLARLEDFQPVISDRLLTYIRKLDMDDMRKPNAMPMLRNDLLKQVNSASYPVPVMDIIFRQFVIM